MAITSLFYVNTSSPKALILYTLTHPLIPAVTITCCLRMNTEQISKLCTSSNERETLMSQANSGASSQDSNSQAASNQAGLSSGTWEIDNIKQDIIKANKELK